MSFLEQVTTRYDGSTFKSKRCAKLHVHHADQAHACTGVSHAAVVLSDVLGTPVTAGQITRRTRALKRLCVSRGIYLKWVKAEEMFPEEATPGISAA